MQLIAIESWWIITLAIQLPWLGFAPPSRCPASGRWPLLMALLCLPYPSTKPLDQNQCS